MLDDSWRYAHGEYGVHLYESMESAFQATYVPGSSTLLLAIDVKPGDYPNPINLRSQGTTSVAVLTANGFDATSIDPATCRFAGAAPVQWRAQDVNHDRNTDLLLSFRTQELDLSAGAVTARLTGNTQGGQAIEGADSVIVLRER